MREITSKIYDFDELSEKVQNKVINNLRNTFSEGEAECVNDDFNATLDKIMNIFGIKVTCYNNCNYKWKFNNDDMYQKPLLRWLNNNIYPYITKGKYYSSPMHMVNGRYHYVCRYSKVLFDNFSCCLTGTYTDFAIDDALNKAYHFVLKGYTTEEFVDIMLQNFFYGWQEEIDYCYTEEHIKDMIDENNLEFYSNGEIYGE